jgi:hypothetical protein
MLTGVLQKKLGYFAYPINFCMADNDGLKIQVDIRNKDGKLVRKDIRFVKFGCTSFFNAQHLFLRLDNIERCFFDHLCEIMDENSNRVLIVKDGKEKFAMKVSKITNGAYSTSIDSVTSAVRKLKLLGLILPVDEGRSYYVVNPKYVFKGRQSQRKWLLKNLIEQRYAEGPPIEALLPMPLDQFLK